MSSILKALKKAEQDGSLYKNNPDLKMNVRRIFDSKSWTTSPKRPLPISKILLSLVIFTAIGFVCFYIFSTSSKLHKPSSSESHSASAALDPVKTDQRASTPSLIKHSEKTIVPKSPSSPVPDTLLETHPAVKKSDQTPEITKRPDAVSTHPTPPTLTLSDTKTALENIPADKNIEQIKDDSFKVQAISWAEIPENRIAVINNNIVGENDFILDYRILTIGKDEIILEKSGKKLSLKFKYR